MIGKEDGKIPEAIRRYIVALYWQSPLLHFESSAFSFFQMTKVLLRGQKSVRNQSETDQTQPLSLPCLFLHPLTRISTPTPIPIATTTTASATATASAAGTTAAGTIYYSVYQSK